MTAELDLSCYPPANVDGRLLLGPGPSTAPPRVLQTMAAPLLGHLDPHFLEIMDRTQELLRYLFQTNNPLTLAVPGTGSAAMEAALANLIEAGDSVLVCINGFFGGRMAEMAHRYGAEVRTLTRPWGEAFDAAEIAAALDQKPAKLVALVHAETSSGVLQPLEEIVQVVHDHDALLLVDAVTSLGGLPVQVDRWDIDACYSGSQKCLSCPPGASPITFGQRAVEVLEGRRTPVANWYLDLSLLRKYWGPERVYHHTAPISTIYALYEGLRMVAEEGLEARWARHRHNAEILWNGLEQMGLELHAPLNLRLPTLTTVRVPRGVEEASIRSRLLHDYNIEIGGGLGELKGQVWRIGLMGFSSRPENVILLLAALERLLP